MVKDWSKISTDLGGAIAKLQSGIPEVMKAFRAMDAAVGKDGALSPKTKELVALGPGRRGPLRRLFGLSCQGRPSNMAPIGKRFWKPSAWPFIWAAVRRSYTERRLWRLSTSSPRRARYWTRSTPAWNSTGRDLRSSHYSVHPRVGGEQGQPSILRLPQSGSSPRGRGTALHKFSHFLAYRFIPAWAGISLEPPSGDRGPSVHPRVGGEQSVWNRLIIFDIYDVKKATKFWLCSFWRRSVNGWGWVKGIRCRYSNHRPCRREYPTVIVAPLLSCQRPCQTSSRSVGVRARIGVVSPAAAQRSDRAVLARSAASSGGRAASYKAPRMAISDSRHALLPASPPASLQGLRLPPDHRARRKVCVGSPRRVGVWTSFAQASFCAVKSPSFKKFRCAMALSASRLASARRLAGPARKDWRWGLGRIPVRSSRAGIHFPGEGPPPVAKP